LDEERTKLTKDIQDRLVDEAKLRDAMKDKQLADLTAEIGNLKRKAEQGSQQTQGEVFELAIEDMLRENFPHDSIQAVLKGVRGADVTQRVLTPSGANCGTILWEVKNTKSFNKDWLSKLRDDQRQSGADLAVIVTVTMPENIKHFGFVDGIWISDMSTALGVACALRTQLIQVALSKVAQEGMSTKSEMLCTYLTGPSFRQRVEGVVEAFVTMQSDIESEKRAMEKTWSKRSKQVELAVRNLAQMYGDFQGVLGASLTEIPKLEMP
jgi:hypothetical protein